MIIDKMIRRTWHKGFSRLHIPSEIIIHGTGGGGTYDWILAGGRAKLYKRGIALFHYLIGDDTKEIISPENWVYHSSCGWHDRKTIGIELSNKDKNNENPYSENQYRQLFDLLIMLFDKYPIRIIMSHNKCKQMYSGKGKVCPGNFDWSRLEQWLTDTGFSWEAEGEERYRCWRPNEI